jgi:hypothetical protein
MSMGRAGDPREVYKRYQHPEDYADPVPMTVEQSWQPKGDTVVSQAFSAINKIRDVHRNYVDAVENNDGLDDMARQDAIAAFANSAEAQYLDSVQSAIHNRVTQARTDYQQHLDSLSPEGDTAQELRNNRAWERERRKLDATENGSLALSLAKNAIENADPATLGVLLQEVPSYLESRNVPTDWVQPVVTQRIPELGEKMARVQQAQRAQAVVDYDIAALRQGFQKGHAPTQLVNPSKYDPDA